MRILKIIIVISVVFALSCAVTAGDEVRLDDEPGSVIQTQGMEVSSLLGQGWDIKYWQGEAVHQCWLMARLNGIREVTRIEIELPEIDWFYGSRHKRSPGLYNYELLYWSVEQSRWVEIQKVKYNNEMSIKVPVNIKTNFVMINVRPLFEVGPVAHYFGAVEAVQVFGKRIAVQPKKVRAKPSQVIKKVQEENTDMQKHVEIAPVEESRIEEAADNEAPQIEKKKYRTKAEVRAAMNRHEISIQDASPLLQILPDSDDRE